MIRLLAKIVGYSWITILTIITGVFVTALLVPASIGYLLYDENYRGEVEKAYMDYLRVVAKSYLSIHEI